jgi:thioredoxin 1
MTDDSQRAEIREQKLEELQQQTAGDDTDSPDTDAGTPSDPIHVDDEASFQDALEDNQVVLVDFYADWCGPCKMIEPVVEEIAKETDAAVAKVDVDANQRLAQQYGVRGVPTLLLFAGGEAVEQFVGVQDKSVLVNAIQKHS